MIEANDNARTNPATEPLNDDRIDPTARPLRQMLDALIQHRAAQANTVFEDRLKNLDQILAMMPPPPLWHTRMKAAGEDGVGQSLLASIREEGWRAFAQGGLRAMRDLADQATAGLPSSTISGTASAPTAAAVGSASRFMIEIGKLGNSGRAAMQRLLKEMEDATGDSADLARCITEIDTDFGYWWCYRAAAHHPGEALEAMIHVAKAVADAEARNSRKIYLVGSTPFPESTLYVFAADHPDARNAAIDIMYDCPGGGRPARRRAPRRTWH